MKRETCQKCGFKIRGANHNDETHHKKGRSPKDIPDKRQSNVGDPKHHQKGCGCYVCRRLP